VARRPPRRAIIEPPPGADAPRRPLGRRLAWFFGLALAAALATAAAAYALKALLPSP
jgi:type VI protein secretion system component VasF